MTTMRVGVLGSGDVGKVLSAGLAGIGHDVMIGSRQPDKLRHWTASQERLSSGTFAESAGFGDLVILATLGVGTEEAIRLAGVDNFDGKVVIDTTNPLNYGADGPELSIGHHDSLGERVQRAIPGARVVKAFNTVGNQHMIRPQFPDGPPDMFICGNDGEAKKTVAALCASLGWGVVDIGGIEGSRYLEPMCLVWVLHGILSGQWNHAFKMLHR